MSVKTTLIIDDKEINVLWFDFSYQRHADASGKPTTPAVFLGLDLAIETRKDINFADWAFAANETRDIELHIAPIILGGSTRVIKFFDCHLLNWHNEFSSTGTAPMHEVLHMSAGGVKDTNSSVEYSAYWRTTYEIDTKDAMSYNDLVEEPHFLGNHFENENGESIEKEEIQLEEIVYLIIESENAVGNNINIDLDDNIRDYEYNGKIIEDDKLNNILITDDIFKIKLKAVKQKN